MKQVRAFALAVVIVSLVTTVAVAGVPLPSITRTVKVVINGHEVGQPGYLIGGSTYVPLRVISETLGADVSWDQETQTASVSEFPGNTEPYRSADKGILYPLTLEQVKEAVVYGQANQMQAFETAFADFCAPDFTDNWVTHYGYASDLRHTCVLYTPWASVAEYAYRMAKQGKSILPVEDMMDWPELHKFQLVVSLFCNESEDLARYKAYVKQGAMILPAESISVRSKEFLNDHAIKPLYSAIIDVTVDLHGLNLSAPLDLLILDPQGHMYTWSWNLYSLK